MPPNELSVGFNTSSDIAQIDALQKRLDTLLHTAREAAAALKGGQGSPEMQAQFRGTVAQIAGVQGAISAVRSSAQINSPSSAMPSIAAEGARAALKQFQDVPGVYGWGGSAMIQAAMESGKGIDAGAQFGKYIPQSIADVVRQSQQAQILASARTLVMPTTAGPTSMMPAGIPTVMMPAVGGAVPTQQMSAMQMQSAITGGMPFQHWGRARSFQMSPGMQAGGGVAGWAGYQALGMSTREIISGSTDISGQANMMGGLLGGILGGLAGQAIPGVGPIVGGMAGMTMGGAIGERLVAPMERDKQTMGNLWGVQGLMGGDMSGRMSWATALADSARAGSNMRTVSAQAVAGAYASMTEGLIAGGVMPGDARSRGPMPGMLPLEGGTSAGTLIRNAASQGVNTLRMGGWAAGEDLSATITRRVFARYPDDKTAAGVIDRIRGIYATEPETGGNLADVLSKFGAVGSFQYLQSQVEPGVLPRMSLRELTQISAGIRSAGRSATLGGLATRGSGNLVYGALSRQLEEIERIPGGRDSLAFAETFAGMRDAGRNVFDQASIMSYDIPATRLNAQREALHYMPFAPGNRAALEMRGIRMSQDRLGSLRGYMRSRMARGEMTESEQLDIEQQMAGLQIGIARGIGTLSEGMLDRMPAMMVGGVNGMGRFNSMQMAALSLRMMGNPMRGFGAMGGRQARMQEEFVGSFGLGDTGPHSRTEGFNNQVVELLQRLVNATEANKGGFQRANRGDGGLEQTSGPGAPPRY